MNLAAGPCRIIETIDRRVLGATAFVDALTGLPAAATAKVEVRGATLAADEVPLLPQSVQIRQNRGGLFVIFRAPYFDDYSATFIDPQPPDKTAHAPLRLRLAVTDAGPSYLPQEFQYDLPRSAASLFVPSVVRLFRAPNAPAQTGWTVLRTRVTKKNSDPPEPLPGVLIRVFRTPRGDDDAPIGEGMTEWRGSIRGEALVPLTGIRRFWPGADAHVVETEQTIEFEVARDSQFTGAAGQLPDVGRMPPGSQPELVEPADALSVRTGREYVIHLAMP